VFVVTLHQLINSAFLLKDTNSLLHLMTIKLRFVVLVLCAYFDGRTMEMAYSGQASSVHKCCPPSNK